MTKIVRMTLLLVILAHIGCDNTVSSAGLLVTKEHIRRCLCKVLPNGRQKCRYPLFPRNPAQMQNLIKCFCSKKYQHKFVEFQPVCSKWHHDYAGCPGCPFTLA